MNWSAFFMALAAPLARQVLVSLGIGIVAFTGVELAINSGFDLARSHFGGFTGDAAQILALSGIGQALGIVAGGVMARVSMIQLKRLIPK